MLLSFFRNSGIIHNSGTINLDVTLENDGTIDNCPEGMPGTIIGPVTGNPPLGCTQPELINDLIIFQAREIAYDSDDDRAPAGVFTITVTFTNTTSCPSPTSFLKQ